MQLVLNRTFQIKKLRKRQSLETSLCTKLLNPCVHVNSWFASVLQIFDEYSFDSGYEDLSNISGSDKFDSRYEQLDLDLSASSRAPLSEFPTPESLMEANVKLGPSLKRKRKNKLKPFPIYRFKEDIFQLKDFRSIDKHAEQVKMIQFIIG